MTTLEVIREADRFLYLLKFKNGTHFKIGISSGNLARVLTIHRSFDVDAANSFLVISSMSGEVERMEQWLLGKYIRLSPSIDEYVGFPKSKGLAEVRKIECWQNVIDDVTLLPTTSIHSLSDVVHLFKEKKAKKKRETDNEPGITVNVRVPASTFAYLESLSIADRRTISGCVRVMALAFEENKCTMKDILNFMNKKSSLAELDKR